MKYQIKEAYGYAPANRCFPLGHKKPAMKTWLSSRKLYLGETNIGNRYFISVLHGTKQRFMDIITGTMYEPKGLSCLSSNYLHIKKIKRIEPDINKLIDELKKKIGN
jgi:hypothetical protein